MESARVTIAEQTPEGGCCTETRVPTHSTAAATIAYPQLLDLKLHWTVIYGAIQGADGESKQSKHHLECSGISLINLCIKILVHANGFTPFF